MPASVVRERPSRLAVNLAVRLGSVGGLLDTVPLALRASPLCRSATRRAPRVLVASRLPTCLRDVRIATTSAGVHATGQGSPELYREHSWESSGEQVLIDAALLDVLSRVELKLPIEIPDVTGASKYVPWRNPWVAGWCVPILQPEEMLLVIARRSTRGSCQSGSYASIAFKSSPRGATPSLAEAATLRIATS